MKGGRICHAQAGEIDGEPAFFEIIRWKDGRFEIGPFQPAESDSIFKGWEHLLIEGIRQGDEGKSPSTRLRATERPPVLTTGWATSSSPEFFSFSTSSGEGGGQGSWAPFPAGRRNAQGTGAGRRGLFLFLAAAGAHPHTRPGDRSCRESEKRARVADFLEAHGPVDLLTLDIQMPVMQGDTALKHVMIRHSIPVLILSSFGKGATGNVFEFLKLGAVNFLPKPSATDDIESYGERLRDLVKRAASRQRHPLPAMAKTPADARQHARAPR